MSRPYIYVLAGVNGSGKSSLGSRTLEQIGRRDWFNPDTYAQHISTAIGLPLEKANGEAWMEGKRRLENTIANGHNFAFETTLGGNTIARILREASATHDILMWFCGLDSPEHHLARVKLRVLHGGHNIPEAKIRERFETSRKNLIALLPHLAQLQVYDNSTDAPLGQPIPDPILLLQLEAGRITYPNDIDTLKHTPDWAKPILMAVMQLQG